MALTYFFSALPFTFVAGYLLETQGVQRVVWLGGALITVAGWLRFAGYGKDLFWLAFVGQTVGGVAQCMVGLNVLMPVGVNWFGDRERMVASTIGMLCNILGMGGAYAIVPSVVGDDGSRFFYVLLGVGVLVACGGCTFSSMCRSPCRTRSQPHTVSYPSHLRPSVHPNVRTPSLAHSRVMSSRFAL
jgi:hypothetical protein